MSTYASPGGSSSSPSTTLSLPVAIAVSLGLLVLLSALLLLASYVCCRRQPRDPDPGPSAAIADGIVVPRIIFVAEDDEGDGGWASGLDQAAISSYPKFPFSAASGGDTACSICLCEYREGEMLRMIPDCRHYFHLLCIDVWLRLNASCPVCRTSPLPTPVSTPISTPLSELVPLSLFAADRRRRS
ncbi:RING-H2 finger protein [Musa troglodytarum]|uniref:RING-H2 finger protein n=1 Tax=Musa troglodytarum TaxID=320322 RepID=A0A9E7I272_9LILI|nr:RING-H2 finger protein [Musa troglodytarum]